MKRLSILTKIMFCLVAVLLVITVALGVVTAVRDSKEKRENKQNATTVSPIPTQPGAPGSEGDATATPEPTPTEKPTPTPATTGGHKIALDPGQQKKNMSEQEPIGPGAAATTTKMSYGATSTTTGKREYEWSLPFTMLLKEELIARGYEVFMTRETHDVSISNAERAQMSNESGAEIYVCIQADAATNTSAYGIASQIPSRSNPFVAPLYDRSKSLAKNIQNSLVASLGAKDRGVQENDSVAAINYSKVPVTVLQLGFMSNETEDANLWNEEYQKKMVLAICDGIDEYFRNQE